MLTDLHLHLDGAISVASASELVTLSGVREYTDFRGVRHPIPAVEDLGNALAASPDCRDLAEFLTRFALPGALLQTRECLSAAAFSLCRELLAIGVGYAELRFAPQLAISRGLAMKDAARAVLDGMRRSGLRSSLILCCMRTPVSEAAAVRLNEETVEVAAEMRGEGVAALDLAGAEAAFPTRDYAGLFRRAVALGLPFTIHAGEADGPDSVLAALDFGAKRIGHGVRALEDPSVVARLARERIPLELCPTSNLVTGVFPSIEDYPLRRLMDAGVVVTINSDDPTVCRTNIRREWELVTKTFSLSAEEIRSLEDNAVRSAFCRVKASRYQ